MSRARRRALFVLSAREPRTASPPRAKVPRTTVEEPVVRPAYAPSPSPGCSNLGQEEEDIIALLRYCNYHNCRDPLPGGSLEVDGCLGMEG